MNWIAIGQQRHQRKFFAPDPPSLPAPPPLPTRQDPAVVEARRRRLLQEKKRRGRPNTNLTGGLGDTGRVDLRTKTLLGS